MQVRKYIGKACDPDALDEAGYLVEQISDGDSHAFNDEEGLEVSFTTDYSSDENPKVVYDVYLPWAEEEDDNQTGYSDFSLQIFMDRNKVRGIARIGHIHMCGSGTDDELNRFPHRYMEHIATEIMDTLVSRAKEWEEVEGEDGDDEEEDNTNNYSYQLYVPQNKYTEPVVDKHPSEEIYDAVLEGDRKNIRNAISRAVDSGIDGPMIHLLMKDALHQAYKRYEDGDYFTPELLLTCRAMVDGLDELNKRGEKGLPLLGKVITGVLYDKDHTMGAILVSMVFRSEGFEVIGPTFGAKPEEIIALVEKEKPFLVAISVPTTVCTTWTQNLIYMLDEAGLRDSTKVIMGGLGITNSSAMKLGADGYGNYATQAAVLANNLLGIEQDRLIK